MGIGQKLVGLALVLLLSGPVQAAQWLVLGDSISAAFGMDREQGWVSLLQQRLNQRADAPLIFNAALSGETSAGGLARLPGLLAEHRPDLLILELGGNDGLRGLPLTQLESNLAAIIEHSQQQGVKVVLLGMKLPPNYGPRYNQGFEQVYRRLAECYQLPWLAFFLEGVGANVQLMQADGIHPNAQAQPILLDNLWPILEKQL